MNKEDIKTKALFYLGITPDENLSEQIDIIYNSTFKKALTKTRWFFARAFMELTEKQETTDNPYKYSYTLPENFLILIDVYKDINQYVMIKQYDLLDKLYVNDDKVFLNYIKLLEEEYLPSYFTDYLELELASDLCYNLTGDSNLLQLIELKRQEKFREAKNIDSRQRPPYKFRTSPFIDVRF